MGISKPEPIDVTSIANRSSPSIWSDSPKGSNQAYGHLNGCAVFLIAGGPSFKNVDQSALQQPGCLTMGVNNSPKSFRPDLWVSVDEPAKFLQSIWLDPKITKFVRASNRGHSLLDGESRIPIEKTPMECPNVIFFESNLKFRAASFLRDESVSWGDKNSDGGRSVMLAALKILFHLGAGHVFLLGVDFEMSADYSYHFPQHRSKESIEGNLKSYRRLAKHFELLQPLFEADNFYVWNCNPDSKLKAFPFCAFDDAVKFATAEMPESAADESTEGLYDRVDGGNDSAHTFASAAAENSHPAMRRVDRNKRPKASQASSLEPSAVPAEDTGILLLADRAMEWLLPWWFHHFEQSKTLSPIAVADFGLSENALQWLEKKNIQIVPRPAELPELHSAWFYKPFIIANSPFKNTVFCDLDCEVRRDLSEMFSWSEHGLVLGNDLYPIGNTRKLFREKFYYNSGLIGVRSDNPTLQHWCDETIRLHETLRSDQEILNLVIYEHESDIVELPPHFHQLRLDGEHLDATIMHWTGPPGKAHIRQQMKELGLKPIV